MLSHQDWPPGWVDPDCRRVSNAAVAGGAAQPDSAANWIGTPLYYERTRSPHMVNIPRALFKTRTGREARYHIAIEETPEWACLGEPLVRLKGFPGVVWERSRREKQPQFGGFF